MFNLPPRFLPPFCLTFIFAVISASLKADVAADAGPDRTVDIESGCSARVALDASESTILAGAGGSFTWTGDFPEGEGTAKGQIVTVTLEKGVHEIHLLVESGTVRSTDTVSISVRDVAPPEIQSVEPSRDSLWPPNHRMVPVEVRVNVTDNCDDAPECTVVDVDSDESEDSQGDGHTEPDTAITGALSVLLRAERAGPGDGRIYTIRVRCRDDDGNISRSQTQVRVPHDMSRDGQDHTVSETHCRLKIRFDDTGKSRIQLRLHVDSADDKIPTNETVPRKDDLEGYELKVALGSLEVAGVVDSKGRAKSDGLLARWDPRKGSLLLSVSSQDLAEALELDPDVGGKRIDVGVPLEVTVTGPSAGAKTIRLFEGTAPCQYQHKARKRK
jgi:hypothetical protein